MTLTPSSLSGQPTGSRSQPQQHATLQVGGQAEAAAGPQAFKRVSPHACDDQWLMLFLGNSDATALVFQLLARAWAIMLCR
jgi:hypothetical protein